MPLTVVSFTLCNCNDLSIKALSIKCVASSPQGENSDFFS